MSKSALIVSAVALVAVGAFFWTRQTWGGPGLGGVRNDAASPRLPAMPAMPDMPAMPSMPGMPTMPAMGHAPNAPRIAPGLAVGPQAAKGLFDGIWGAQ